MIVSFSVSNFRSFSPSGEATLSLVASPRMAGNHDGHAIAIPGSNEKVLRTAVLYGANGAGKSNLFKALRYVRKAVLDPLPKGRGTGRERFRLDTDRETASEFDLQFIANGKLYRFGFTVNDHRITQEWLLQVGRTTEKAIYERVTSASGEVKIELGNKRSNAKLKALATVGGLENQLFLATINGTLGASQITGDVKSVLDWFEASLVLVAPDETFSALARKLEQDPDFMSFANSFLQASSTGVQSLKVVKKEISEDDARKLLPEPLVQEVLDNIGKDGREAATLKRTDGLEVLVQQVDSTPHFYMMAINSIHEPQPGKIFQLNLSNESDGTIRLLELLPALHHLKTQNAVFFVDEIDRSMHPLLVWKFLEFFLKSCPSSCSQVIVTTHESNLLDLDLLRRDEIWFAEKDRSGATQLYSLTDFKPRLDLQIRKHYLQGRFGAIPFLANVDNLAKQEC
jgi:uncharacterized protein